MPTLLFVHGTGVRGESWFRSLELVARKAGKYLPGVRIEGCQWGEAFGARLHRNGATIPGYDSTGNSAPKFEDASRARWFLLAEDPLLELRILPEEVYFGAVPGLDIFNSLIPALASNPALLQLMAEWSAEPVWTALIGEIAADPEWKAVVEGITQSAAAASEKMARAVTAAFQRRLRSEGLPSLSGAERDELRDALIEPLGGPPLGVGDWFLERVTHFGARRRGSLSDGTTPMVGDIIRYQARGAEIRNFIALRAKEVGASLVLAHSLGGVASVDWLASQEHADAGSPIKRLVTAGSQAGYFYELDALVSRTFGAGLPESFPRKWLNFYDRADFLSYLADPAFPGRARDVEVDNGQPFPESHSAYWRNEKVWREIARFLGEN